MNQNGIIFIKEDQKQMAFGKDDKNDLRYKIFAGEDDIFDEKGSTFCALRRVAWYNAAKRDDEPTEDEAKWEVRRWKANDDGTDTANKGMTFLTEEGPHNLAEMLVDKGFGATKKLIGSIKKRDNFKDTVEHMYDEEEINSDEFFDARDELLAE